MQPVTTQDGAVTFFNEQYREHYHTLTGAREEAIRKFAQPCIPFIEERKTVRILDLCFGLGYNTAAALEVFWEFNPDFHLHVTGIEIDEHILQEIRRIDAPFAHFSLIQELAAKQRLSQERLDAELLVGDARELLPSLKQRFDVVFFDPFSRTKHPEMWEPSFLKTLADHCRKGCVLTTYSCARPFRNDLIALGFEIRDGPVVGRRAPSTIAIKR